MINNFNVQLRQSVAELCNLDYREKCGVNHSSKCRFYYILALHTEMALKHMFKL